MKIELGAFSPSIGAQLAAGGLEFAPGCDGDLLDRIKHGIILAHIHGCLTDAEVTKAYQRIMNKIKVQPISGQKKAPIKGLRFQ